MSTYLLAVTEANHLDNEFWQLGGAGFDSSAERAENLAGISRDLGSHVCDNEDRCYLLDVLGDDGWSVVDEFEISEEVAHGLLGVDDFEELRELDRQRVYGDQFRNYEADGVMPRSA